jgi:predicted neuraminidase
LAARFSPAAAPEQLRRGEIMQTKFLRVSTIGLLLAVGLAASAPYKGRAADETVYQMADGVVRPSRVPGAREAYLPIIVNSNHASNLLPLPNGDLLCFWFAGSEEGSKDVSIAMSRLDHGSRKWALPIVISHHANWSNQNPVPFLAPGGRIWVFHSTQRAKMGESGALIYAVSSDDQGHTWSDPRPYFTDPGTFDRQPLVIFHSQWLFPLYRTVARTAVRLADTTAKSDHSVVDISKDEGKTWTPCDVPASSGLVQMNIVKLSQDNLIAFFRSRSSDWIYRSESTDGCHWSDPVATQLPNNNASIQAVRLRDGHLAIIFNNTQSTKKRSESGKAVEASRAILTLALSVDEGNTWPWVRDVQSGKEPPTFRAPEDPEYAYPSITQTPNGKIAISFSFRRETIKYMTFDEDWIKHGTTGGLFKGDPQP